MPNSRESNPISNWNRSYRGSAQGEEPCVPLSQLGEYAPQDSANKYGMWPFQNGAIGMGGGIGGIGMLEAEQPVPEQEIVADTTPEMIMFNNSPAYKLQDGRVFNIRGERLK